jgi:hypothetical protein
VVGREEAVGVIGTGGAVALDAGSDDLPCGVAVGRACCLLAPGVIPLPYYCYLIDTVCADNEGFDGAISSDWATLMCRPCGALGELACSQPRPGFARTYWCNCGLVATITEGVPGDGQNKYVCLNPPPLAPPSSYPPGNGDNCTNPD